ncbi:hypothetical protein ACJRO7_022249 [Eucalyptus globulus]|uniref:Uncharacterized protein n=1 Tax=Eucalyptus globulus TaxID=34317 RepID=A0ABD3KS18_EUCGL
MTTRATAKVARAAARIKATKGQQLATRVVGGTWDARQWFLVKGQCDWMAKQEAATVAMGGSEDERGMAWLVVAWAKEMKKEEDRDESKEEKWRGKMGCFG